MLKKQAGVSYIGVLLLVILAVLALRVIVIIAPAYWDDYVLNKEITQTLNSPTAQIDLSSVKSQLSTRLSLNNLDDFNLDQVLRLQDGGKIVDKAYEVRKPFIGNIDLVLTFKKQFSSQTLSSGGQ
jgi:hypothetical protein